MTSCSGLFCIGMLVAVSGCKSSGSGGEPAAQKTVTNELLKIRESFSGDGSSLTWGA